MNTTCSFCTFLIDLSGLIPESSIPDRISQRCGKEERYIGGFPRAVNDPLSESCESFVKYDPQRSSWEWDENKNSKNIEKHGISFQDAVVALDSDANSFRSVAKDWEDLDDLDYETKGILRSFANTDPVRDVHLFERDGKIWVLVSTLRGELGLMTQRVISVRRARAEEQVSYQLSSHLRTRR